MVGGRPYELKKEEESRMRELMLMQGSSRMSLDHKVSAHSRTSHSTNRRNSIETAEQSGDKVSKLKLQNKRKSSLPEMDIKLSKAMLVDQDTDPRHSVGVHQSKEKSRKEIPSTGKTDKESKEMVMNKEPDFKNQSKRSFPSSPFNESTKTGYSKPKEATKELDENQRKKSSTFQKNNASLSSVQVGEPPTKPTKQKRNSTLPKSEAQTSIKAVRLEKETVNKTTIPTKQRRKSDVQPPTPKAVQSTKASKMHDETTKPSTNPTTQQKRSSAIRPTPKKTPSRAEPVKTNKQEPPKQAAKQKQPSKTSSVIPKRKKNIEKAQQPKVVWPVDVEATLGSLQ
jgi:hypothetical protein